MEYSLLPDPLFYHMYEHDGLPEHNRPPLEQNRSKGHLRQFLGALYGPAIPHIHLSV